MLHSSVFYTVGLLLFAHAGYSVYEVQHLTHHTSIPSDIVAETLVALIATIIAAFISTQNSDFYSVNSALLNNVEPDSPLNDIHANERVSHPHKYLLPIEMAHAAAIFEKAGAGPFAKYESRLDFIDIVKKRLEYKLWLQLEKAI